jgi:hypothetical protein
VEPKQRAKDEGAKNDVKGTVVSAEDSRIPSAETNSDDSADDSDFDVDDILEEVVGIGVQLLSSGRRLL